MQNVYVLPAKDAEGNAKRVPDPFTGAPLSADGAWKPRSQYWLRRLAAQDVSEGEPPAPAAPAKPARAARAPVEAVALAALGE